MLFNGTQKALHLDTERSNIAINTDGATFGHNAAMNSVTAAATFWGSARKGVVPFTRHDARIHAVLSAAAPHLACIAALVLQVCPGYTPAQVKKAMTASAFDTEAVGWDENSGFGIAMSSGAVNYALAH